jgi:hypothetical protein
MTKKWIGVDIDYETLLKSESAALNTLVELPDAKLQNMKRYADLLLEGLLDLPETALELELLKGMVKDVYGISVLIEVAITHKANINPSS